MEKTISVKVSGSEIEQSAVYGGVQGEGGSRQLVISFDEEWQGYSKTVTFLDAHMENPVKIFLNTSNANEDGSYTTQYAVEGKDGEAGEYDITVREDGAAKIIEEGADTDAPKSVTVTGSVVGD